MEKKIYLQKEGFFLVLLLPNTKMNFQQSTIFACKNKLNLKRKCKNYICNLNAQKGVKGKKE